MSVSSKRSIVGELNEGPLHAALKRYVAGDDGDVEVPVDGKLIDVVRGDLLIEIQTGSFGAIRRKLETLLDAHDVRLVHPVACVKHIVKLDDNGDIVSRRKSPRRGRVEEVFENLVAIPHLVDDVRFTLEILLTEEEEVRRYEHGRVRRRKGWVIVERRLLDVISMHRVASVQDLVEWLPDDLPQPFTTRDVAQGLSIARDLARKMVYCLRETGALDVVGRKRDGVLYTSALK